MSKSLLFTSLGKGQPLVFIHGWGLNSGVWQAVKEKLVQHYQVITIDLPGFGLNVEQQLSPYSLTQISELIIEAIDQPAIFIGWSLGGLVATDIALRYPDQVQGLVTIASSPYFIEEVDNTTSENAYLPATVQATIKWYGIKSNVLSMFNQQLGKDIKKTLDGFLKIQALGSPSIRSELKQLRDIIMQYSMPSKTTLADSLQLLSSEDLRSELHKIEIPFLRLYGRLDSLVPKAAIAQINQLTPSSDYYIFEKASHAPFISHVDEFVEQLTRWLNTHFS